MRNAFWRRAPDASARPIQTSLIPLWYSQQLSKNVMPASTASCTIRSASS
jgi:hypothetical protein